MSERPDDICPRPERLPELPAEPLAPPIYPSSVYQCHDTRQAAALLDGTLPGYAYLRDGHPNADLLAAKCRALHTAERAAVTASGMAALALAVVGELQAGDHLIASSLLYGRSLRYLAEECPRLGIGCTVVDTCDLAATEKAFTSRTRLLVVETITNPLLRVSDLGALAELAHRRGARLLVDNTLASPILCRPIELGADFVLESLTKIMSGHSDVLLGLLCGHDDVWQRIPNVLSTWGWTAAPWDCWLAQRGLGTLALRMERASASALAVAKLLASRCEVEATYYPGLPEHPDHAIAQRQFGERFGTMVSFTLPGGTAAAERFIAQSRIPLCPSFGDLSTTLSHPASTSHRYLDEPARRALGIRDGTIRLSMGIESTESILAAVAAGLAAG